jgi:hypothetical protein
MENIKWGLFLKGELMVEYPATVEGYKEALKDADFAYQETGIPHEVKKFRWIEEKR